MTIYTQTYFTDDGFENYEILKKDSLNYFDPIKNSNKS